MTKSNLKLVVPISSKCVRCDARQEGLCSALSGEQLDRVSHRAVRQHIKAGTSLALEGDEVTMHISLLRGVAKLIKTLPDGRQQIVGLHFAPSAAISAVAESSVSIEAATDLEICMVPAPLIDEMGERARQVDIHLLQQTRRDLEEARDWLLALGRKSALEKLASFIIMIVEKYDQPLINGTLVSMPLPRAEIGDFLGVTIETISRSFTKLKNLRAIAVENTNSVVILNARQLKQLASK